MKILNIPDSSGDSKGEASPTPPAPSVDLERVEALEHVAKSIFQKLQAIEERIQILEETPKKSPAADPPTLLHPASRTPEDVAHFDADSVRKGLLTKMWKYLNDQAAA